jgi:FkbM family methyltransferase
MWARLKKPILKFMRQAWLQPFWAWLGHIGKIGQNYWATSIEHSGELAVLEKLAPRLRDAVIVDVGANRGQYAAAAMRLVAPRVLHCFEPSSAAFDQLKTIPGIQAHNLALGETSGDARLFSAEPGATIASLLPLRFPIRPFAGVNDETVSVTTLDEFCAEHGIATIGLLKIDVEGAELGVLKGARAMLERGAIRFVQFEFGEGHIDARTYLRDFFDLLDGFDFFRVIPSGLFRVEYSPEIEVFAPINYLAAAPGELPRR